VLAEVRGAGGKILRHEAVDSVLWRRTNHKNLHVHGYKEEGTTTWSFATISTGSISWRT
jgi:phosphoketolase